ncbi:MAG: diguanylate cyclase, partial [Burkholderiaceae bacterium]|nr:diguanylate cyclase [Burkholderiaceae bacterium]
MRFNKPSWGAYLVVCIVLMVCTTAFFLLREQAQIWTSATQNSRDAAISLQTSMSSLLAQSVASIEGIQHHLQDEENTSGNEAIRITRSAMRFDPLSTYLGFRDRISGRYFVMDRDGHLVNTASGRYLATQWTNPNSDQVEILPLLQMPGDSTWYMPLLLKIQGREVESDLTFALVSVNRLVAGTSHLKTMPGSFLVIINTNGRRLLRLKKLDEPQDINGPPVAQDIVDLIKKHKQGNFERVSALDGVRSIFGYSVSDSLPFQVAIGVPVKLLYARWATQSLAPLIVLLVSVSLIAWLGSRLKAAFRQLQATTTEQAYAARHDKLTGLLSREAFIHDVNQQMSAASAQDEPSAEPATVMLLNLNRFKDINDTLGHEAGDSLLVEVGRRLTDSLAGHQALIARLGGDEFAVYMAESTASNWLSQAPQSGYAQVSRRLQVHRSELEFSASIGYANWPQDAASTDELLRCADVAMNHAKLNLKPMSPYLAAFDSFSPDMLELRADFIKALRSEGLSLDYQAKVRLSDGALIGVEALARWVHPSKGHIPPLTFIPLAENSELIHDFTHFVLEAALLQAKAWEQAGHPLPVAVNLSVNNLL